MSRQSISAPFVLFPHFGVLAAVNLDDQALGWTGKIRYEACNSMLSTELESLEPASSKVIPEDLLSIRLITTEAPGNITKILLHPDISVLVLALLFFGVRGINARFRGLACLRETIIVSSPAPDACARIRCRCVLPRWHRSVRRPAETGFRCFPGGSIPHRACCCTSRSTR